MSGLFRACAELLIDGWLQVTGSACNPRRSVELKKYDRMGEIPFSAIVRAMPNLKDKQASLKDIEQQQAQAAQRAQSAQPQGQPPALQQLQLRGAMAEVAETESKAALIGGSIALLFILRRCPTFLSDQPSHVCCN
jgi:hypothetical protein